jgi:glyoxylase-like metal-dependent hydrolase (beta-lactamase superfamily II)
VEQERRTESIRPGLWSVPVPIPDNPLGHTLVYAFETPRGPVLVDAGWDDDGSWRCLEEGLAVAGFRPSDVYGVLVTHAHPDHHGLSGRIREASGAWVALHPADATLIAKMGGAAREHAEEHAAPEKDYRDEVAAMLLDAGAPEDEVRIPRATPAGKRDQRPRHRLVEPDRFLADGERVDVPGWAVDAVWTPGHSPGHVCFRLPDHGILLAGDHVLPSITPHISLSRADRGADPLGDFLASLVKVDRPDIAEVLPAHEHRFHGLHDRVVEITAHHQERLDALELLLAAGPTTLWDLSKGLPWNRPWTDLGLSMKRAAVNETAAHLRHLTVRGRARRIKGHRPLTFEAVPA